MEIISIKHNSNIKSDELEINKFYNKFEAIKKEIDEINDFFSDSEDKFNVIRKYIQNEINNKLILIDDQIKQLNAQLLCIHGYLENLHSTMKYALIIQPETEHIIINSINAGINQAFKSTARKSLTLKPIPINQEYTTEEKS